ncbi:MAG: hypothetical protein IJ527_04935 [Prevotella sp.]|nr:hypothetical protein [Prevotella sp.]
MCRAALHAAAWLEIGDGPYGQPFRDLQVCTTEKGELSSISFAKFLELMQTLRRERPDDFSQFWGRLEHILLE